MAIGIWTPVLLSARQVSFPDLLNNFAAKVRTVTSLAAGTHMRFTNLGCYPIYVHTSAPANDTVGLTGVPIGPNSNLVLPQAPNLWIYSPYENGTTIIDIGTLT